MLTKTDLRQIDETVAKRIKKEIAPIKKDITKIRKGMNEIIGFFDNEYLELRKRIERIEDHLSLPPISN